MSQTKLLALLAGAALSIGAPALAQNANLDQNRAFAAELAADASSRTSLQGGGGSAGHDGRGFMVTDGGGNTLYIGGDAQFQYTMNFRDEDSAGDQDDFTHGFNNGEVRLRTWGTVWSKDLSYKIQGNFQDGGFTLEDAFGKYSFENGAYVTWGQFKTPVLWEELVDDVYQLAVDRSVTSIFFGAGRTQGVAVGYQADQFRIVGSFNDGAGTDNTYFTSGSEADYALSARGEFKWAGDWSQFDDFTSFRSAKTDLAGKVGAGVHWQDGGETGGTSDAQFLLYTIDVAVEGKGWNAFAAFVGDQFEPEGSEETTNFAFVVQGGIFLADQFELFARVDAIFPDDEIVDDDDLWFVTAGGNYYISPESHAAKFTGEVGYSINDSAVVFDGTTGLVGSSDDTGFLGQDDDGEFYVRLQMQVLF